MTCGLQTILTCAGQDNSMMLLLGRHTRGFITHGAAMRNLLGRGRRVLKSGPRRIGILKRVPLLLMPLLRYWRNLLGLDCVFMVQVRISLVPPVAAKSLPNVVHCYDIILIADHLYALYIEGVALEPPTSVQAPTSERRLAGF